MVTRDANFDIAQVIPTGHAHAVSRKYLASVTGMSDRMVRREIEKSNAPIVNLGYGYFVADREDDIDRSEAAAYVSQENARINAIRGKLDAKFRDFERPAHERDVDDELER